MKRILSVISSEEGYIDILPPEMCSEFNIAVLPVFYTVNGKPYYNGINSGIREDGEICYKGVPADVYYEVFSSALDDGNDGIFVFCPHSKFYTIRSNAAEACRRLKRLERYADADIRIIDTKSCCSGTAGIMMKTLRYMHETGDTDGAYGYAKKLAESAETVIIGDGNETDVRIIRGNNVSSYLLHRKTADGSDRYITRCISFIIRNGCDYSLTGNEEYRKSIVSEITARTGKPPLFELPHGTSSAAVFNDKCTVVSLF